MTFPQEPLNNLQKLRDLKSLPMDVNGCLGFQTTR